MRRRLHRLDAASAQSRRRRQEAREAGMTAQAVGFHPTAECDGRRTQKAPGAAGRSREAASAQSRRRRRKARGAGLTPQAVGLYPTAEREVHNGTLGIQSREAGLTSRTMGFHATAEMTTGASSTASENTHAEASNPGISGAAPAKNRRQSSQRGPGNAGGGGTFAPCSKNSSHFACF